MFCPCCNNHWNRLWVWHGLFVQCVRRHKFAVRDDGDTIELVHTSDSAGQVGQTFPVPEGEHFNQEIEIREQDWADMQTDQGHHGLQAVYEFLEQGDRVYIVDGTNKPIGRVVRKHDGLLEIRTMR